VHAQDTPTLVILVICLRASGRFVLRQLAPGILCTWMDTPERARLSANLTQVGATSARYGRRFGGSVGVQEQVGYREKYQPAGRQS